MTKLAEMIALLSTQNLALSDQMVAHFDSMFLTHVLQIIIIVTAIFWTRGRDHD